MAESIIIPTLDESFYTTRVTLDGTDYNLGFNYNTREKRWYLDIFDVENQPLLLGTKIVCLWPLAQYQKEARNLPPGILYCASGTNDNSPPEFGELGENRRCQLTYWPEDPSTI